MDFKLSDNQVTQIAKMLYLNLDEIKNYIEMHQVEYNEFLEEEQKENTKDKSFANNNSVWQQYTDGIICKVKINTNIKQGGI